MGVLLSSPSEIGGRRRPQPFVGTPSAPEEPPGYGGEVVSRGSRAPPLLASQDNRGFDFLLEFKIAAPLSKLKFTKSRTFNHLKSSENLFNGSLFLLDDQIPL